MFERYLADALARHFKHIILDFDANQVKVSVWNGEVVLKDLKLRPDALQQLINDREQRSFEDESGVSVPFHIVYGSIGTFELHIPWKILRLITKRKSNRKSLAIEKHKGCSVVLSDVDILIAPGESEFHETNVQEQSDGKSSEDVRVQKEHAVQTILNEVLFQDPSDPITDEENTASNDLNDDEESSSPLVKQLIQNILASLSITIKNIHLRYEDTGDCIGFENPKAIGSRKRIYNDIQGSHYRPPFSVGIVLEEFSLGSTDHGPKLDSDLFKIPNFDEFAVDKEQAPRSHLGSKSNEYIEDDEECITLGYTVQHKLAAATNLSIYWDSELSSHDLIHKMLERQSFLRQYERNHPSKEAKGRNIFIHDDDDFYDVGSMSMGDSSEHEEMKQRFDANYFASKFNKVLHANNAHRNFILNPISVSLHGSIVSTIKTSQEGSERTSSTRLSFPTPPSRAVLSLESCQVNITKNTLEDIAYLRRSITLWNDMKRNKITQQLFLDLTEARPRSSAKQSPRLWWKYAFRVVTALCKIQHNTKYERNARRKKGWLGFVEGVKMRKRYVSLYQNLLSSNSSLEKEYICQNLTILEDELQPEEIAAYRIHLLEKISGAKSKLVHVPGASVSSKALPEGDLLSELEHDEPNLLSFHYRESIISRMDTVFSDETEKLFDYIQQLSIQTKESLHTITNNVKSVSKCNIVLICPKTVLQIDRIQRFSVEGLKRIQIAQFRCATVQKFALHSTNEWDIISTFASLEILDQSKSFDLEKKILTKKEECMKHASASTGQLWSQNTILIENQSHFHSATVFIRRSFPQDIEKVETYPTSFKTFVNVKVSPMEIIYAPDSMRSLSQVFQIRNAAEFSHDIQRLKTIMSNWRIKQKDFLYRALSHSKSTLVTNVDISSPVFIMHDETSNGIMVFDFGRLTFRNNLDVQTLKDGYDDTWKLKVQDIQVICMPSENLHRTTITKLVHHHTKNHLVEPFSLEFMLHTKFNHQILSREDGAVTLSSDISIDATMPRLVFNFHSSSIRLLNRITEYRKIRKRDLENTKFSNYSERGEISDGPVSTSHKTFSRVDFNFSAPFIALNLIDDSAHERSSSKKHLVELVLRGSRGQISQTSINSRIKSRVFSINLNGLYARDLYQKAGSDFSMLISSQQPELLFDENQNTLISTSSSDTEGLARSETRNTYDRSDLFSLRYENKFVDSDDHEKNPQILSIETNELYIEWNPETIACIQKSLRLSTEERIFFRDLKIKNETKSSSDDTNLQSFENDIPFFDALEENEESYEEQLPSKCPVQDQFYSPVPTKDDSNYLLSPISIDALQASLQRSTTHDDYDRLSCQESTHNKNISISFCLSKLRVRFNKESRLRRLVVAEMNETKISYQTKSSGGGKTVARVGNFKMIDPAHTSGSTLYGEIIGFQSEAPQSSSMLEITYETFLRSQDSSPEGIKAQSKIEHAKSESFRIDSMSRRVYGADSLISIGFSPMRFVYLQQLWFEIIDYFFEGILGDEVWGRDRPDFNKKREEQEHDVIERIKSLFSPENDETLLPWADAFGIRFLRFNIFFDSPVIILPVEYKSPQHMRFDLSNIEATNWFSADIDNLMEKNAFVTHKYVQWFNNCMLKFEHLQLKSWCGTPLNIDEYNYPNSIPVQVLLKWPIGPTSFLRTPKWNIRCAIEKLRLLIRKSDYALFQHILQYNIGEESRHLVEWNELQNLPLEKLEAYKKNILVHFGYDKKDTPPTTLNFAVDISSITAKFCMGENDNIADLSGESMKWSLRKMSDRISRQLLTFRKIHLTRSRLQRSESLLFPLQNEDRRDEDAFFNLIYRSTSKPDGDIIKYLEVNDACIYFNYSFWMEVLSIFQNLSDPDILSNNEVLNSIQISDRWYSINKNKNSNSNKECNDGQRNENVRDQNEREKTGYQLRILLNSPRIVLVGSSSLEVKNGRALTFRLNHLDYLYKRDRRSQIRKTLLVHNLEVFTTMVSDAISKFNGNEENSLIYPLCFGGEISNTYDVDGNLLHSEKWISSDVISARTAYTDMTLAIDVCINLLSDYNQVKINSVRNGAVPSYPSSSERMQTPSVNIGLSCGGIDLVVIDDSGRHFANAQELIQISLSGILFRKSEAATAIENGPSTTVRLQLHNIELHDCLQSPHSPFRIIAIGNHLDSSEEDKSNSSSRWSAMNKTIFADSMSWNMYCFIDEEDLGYKISESMIHRRSITFRSIMNKPFENQNLVDVSYDIYNKNRHDYTVRIKSVVLQWNPSMAIALQRFLGRLTKYARERSSFAKVTTTLFTNERKKTSQISSDLSLLTAEAWIESLTICLNKEDQQRRLLQITMSRPSISFRKDLSSHFTVQGQIGDFNVWDSDGNREGQVPLSQDNRLVVGVLDRPSEDHHALNCEPSELKDNYFVSFYYYSSTENQEKKGTATDVSHIKMPNWVRLQVGDKNLENGIDDFLSISIASARFNHIKERTGEIIDYLSNGLPGKGMGVTSRAAKGFIAERIKTKSFLDLSINSPQLFLPRNRGTDDGVLICFGDVRLRSWFDEATLEECKAICCNDLARMQDVEFATRNTLYCSNSSNGKDYWWRILSLSVLGLGWCVVHREKDLSAPVFIENPINLFFQLRKPPSHNDLPLIARCKVSLLDLVLSYTDYIMIHNVINENLGKDVDKTFWDHDKNGLEALEEPEQQGTNASLDTQKVKYSKDARFVRFGADSSDTKHGHGHNDSITVSLDMMCNIEGIFLILRRNDTSLIQGDLDESSYDIVCFQIEDINFSLTSSSLGNSASATLQSVSLVDLGDTGRIVKERMKNNDIANFNSFPRKPSAFYVIAEKYQNKRSHSSQSLDIDPQLILKIDTKTTRTISLGAVQYECEKADITSVCLTLNQTNINPLIRPLSDVVSFLSRKWTSHPDGNEEESSSLKESKSSSDSHLSENVSASQNMSHSSIEDQNSHFIKGFHFSVITNHTRIFLLADETDPETRALVLKGLSAVNVMIVKEMDSSNNVRSTILSAEGQLKALESYINPNPKQALEHDLSSTSSVGGNDGSPDEIQSKYSSQTLGIALIEPLTAAFTFRQVQRVNFPITRESSVTIESISTTLSFEDCRLLEIVLSRWKSERNYTKTASFEPSTSEPIQSLQNKSQTKIGSRSESRSFSDHKPILSVGRSYSERDMILSYSESIEEHQSPNCCGNITLPESLCIKSNSGAASYPKTLIRAREYEINFWGEKLGLVLRQSDSKVVVEEVLKSCQFSGLIRVGDEITKLAGEDIVDIQEFTTKLAESNRPINIRFKTDVGVCENSQDDVFEVELKESRSEEKSLVSVTRVLADKNPSDGNAELQENMKFTERSIPVTVVMKRGFDSGLTIEKSLCGNVPVVTFIDFDAFFKASVNPSAFRPEIGSVILVVNSDETSKIGYAEVVKLMYHHSLNSGEGGTYSLTFLKAKSEKWGNVDKLDVVISNIKLTLIDDINGRDMPLLRSNFENVMMKVERGIGLECNSIQVKSPSIFSLLGPDETSALPYVIHDLSETISKLYGNAEISIDYYNARNANWEPLIESFFVSGEVENQMGSVDRLNSRPGELSVAICDFKVDHDDRATAQPLICVNFSDSAAEMLIIAMYEWKLWRKTLKWQSNALHIAADNPSDSLSKSFSFPSPTQKEYFSKEGDLAAQNAADAAFIYAQRRGNEGHKIGEAKSFILKNRTGMTVKFVSEAQKIQKSTETDDSRFTLCNYKEASIITVSDGNEARFSLDTIDQAEWQEPTDPAIFMRNKVRSYDGTYPLLSVCIISSLFDTRIEVLEHLSVVRIGENFRSVLVEKKLEPSKTKARYITIVWNVSLEKNRRVITISSAAKIVSPRCLIPIEIGVKEIRGKESDESNITSLGTSTCSTDCFLPLNLELSDNRAKIYIRPASCNEYEWGESSILHLHKESSSTSNSVNDYRWKPSEKSTMNVCRSSGHSPIYLSSQCLFHSDDILSNDAVYDPSITSVLCIEVLSNLNVRNGLPTCLEWEISHMRSHMHSSVHASGSHNNDSLYESLHSTASVLESGDSIDVFNFDLTRMNVSLRVRCDKNHKWTEWIPINHETSSTGLVQTSVAEFSKERCDEYVSLDPRGTGRDITVQSRTKFGAPLTLGVKIRPRKSLHKESRILGFEIIVYSELWLKNLTDLPIVFGAPSMEILSPFATGVEHTENYGSSTKLAAYSALLELNDILDFDFNERDKDFSTSNEDLDILTLPVQESDSLVEEIFEYVELEKGIIKKRWWGGEQHDSRRPDPTMPREDSKWEWDDPEWTIDTAGECTIANDGWESCSNLFGGKSRRFSPLRTFNPDHRFRRRRWFRRKSKKVFSDRDENVSYAFFQPVLDHTARLKHSKGGKESFVDVPDNATSKRGFLDGEEETNEEEQIKLCLRVDDGVWSSVAAIPSTGFTHGVMQLHSARWPTISKDLSTSKTNIDRATGYGSKTELRVSFSPGSTSRKVYDVSYQVAAVEGQWGEHTRLFVVYPRFYLRNDSEEWYVEVKQLSSPDETAVRLQPGSSAPFYWTDILLPKLISVRLRHKDCLHEKSMFMWSGPFDISILGMLPLRLRKSNQKKVKKNRHIPDIAVVRSQVQLRSGTGGTGLCISFKEELASGENSLYRVENHSPFPVWIMQDSHYNQVSKNANHNIHDLHSDVIMPGESCAFGLDTPFLQLNDRKAASLEELLKIRMSLAPPHTRDGKETMKKLSLGVVGNNVRLKPSKLCGIFDEDKILDLMCTNINCEVSNDGPSRVLQFSIVKREISTSTVIKHSVLMHSAVNKDGESVNGELCVQLNRFADKALALLNDGEVPRYDPRLPKRLTYERNTFDSNEIEEDFNFSVRVSFTGILISFIDRAPSEIAVLSLKKIEAMSQWNRLRSKDVSAALSVEWIQFDNHCPNAPFPVAFCPAISHDSDEDEENELHDPFFSIGVIIAPKHKSKIMCLKGITVSLRDISIGVDIALISRFQHFFLCMFNQLEKCRAEKNDALLNIHSRTVSDHSGSWHLPLFEKINRLRTSSTGTKKDEYHLYFETLTIMPFTVKLSVAPAVALSSAQAALEGPEASAIHAAVRKGDLFIDEKAAGVLGVKIGSKNVTALAVIRGIFRSILVDSLLKCDDVSLLFSGLVISNHLSTMAQLRVLVGQHYLSVLKGNVPALLGSLAAFGNPVGLIRGFGDGVVDFVSEPVKGFKKSVKELDPSYVMDGVAKGTGSLARHTVGGIVDSASLLTETFSKNMAVLTLDRKYAQRRDRFKTVPGSSVNFVEGVESGFTKLVRGVAEGVIGVVRAPMRGAEKRGMEGFAKGVGKGLLGLIVKPVIGLSDAATDVMIGVKGSIEVVSSGSQRTMSVVQVRPRRAVYGADRRIRPYAFVDAISSAILMKTSLAGEEYLTHIDLGGRVVIISIRRFLLLGDDGEAQLIIKLKSIKSVEVRQSSNNTECGVVIMLKSSRRNVGNDTEVIYTDNVDVARELCAKIRQSLPVDFR